MSRPFAANRLGSALALFALTALVIALAWRWLGAPVQLPPSPLGASGKLYCVSYAPFRGSQNPLDDDKVSAEEIDADLALLSKYTNCVRTYSVDDVRDDVLVSARRYGLKVLYGIWVSDNPQKTATQIATAIGYAKKYADVISAVIVGNEVLLRGELAAADLAARIREVKAQIPEPVSYADVWEFWLRYPDVAGAVDFVTIHILPYWEDFPLPAARAAAHVADIRSKVAAAFPGKEIVIGEFGWPSAGRMREDARPSPSNQARAIGETLALAQREHFRVNVIEAFDQPWKRGLEGAVGGYWGIFDRATGGPKFTLGGAVSDHPHWLAQALAGIALAAAMFAAAAAGARSKEAPPIFWPVLAASATLSAVLFGWTLETVPVESFSFGSWLRSLAFAAPAAAAPIAAAAACAARRPLPSFATLLARPRRQGDGLGAALAVCLVALVLLALQAALGLVFDPRYRDIPFAPLFAAVAPLLVVSFLAPRPAGRRAAAESLAALVLGLAAVYVAINETFANWQALWFCAGLLGLAVILIRVRDVPG